MSRDVLSIVAEVIKMLESIPEAKPILDGMKEGKVDHETAMRELTRISLMAGKGESLMSAAGQMKTALGVGNLPVAVKHPNGTTMMNPILEAAIAERASIDGDVPEFRNSPIPDGAKPAVPVITSAMDPVVVGMQLEIASEGVKLELSREHDKYLSMCKEIQQIVDSKQDKELAIEVMRRYIPSPPTGVTGYEAGKLPVPRQAQDISVKDLTSISRDRASRYAYNAVATTQGRNSVSPVIEAEVVKKLRELGLQVTEEEPIDGEDLGESGWSTVMWGPEDVSPDFNSITTAIASIVDGVQKKSEGYTSIWVKIRPINGIADRNFGWSAKIKGNT